MMRIWGLLKPQCLPVFARSAENLDILATLFRLLTRLALNPNEPDEVLLDECCLLPSQVLIPQIQFISSQYSVASPIIFYTSNINLPLNVSLILSYRKKDCSLFFVIAFRGRYYVYLHHQFRLLTHVSSFFKFS